MSGVRFLVSGEVQGVGYRRFVQRTSTKLGVTGRVRNLADGRVEVEVWGNPSAVNDLGDRLMAGPATANVTKVEKHEILDEMEVPSAFLIVR